jgi:hypothetical protein
MQVKFPQKAKVQRPKAEVGEVVGGKRWWGVAVLINTTTPRRQVKKAACRSFSPPWRLGALAVKSSDV